MTDDATMCTVIQFAQDTRRCKFSTPRLGSSQDGKNDTTQRAHRDTRVARAELGLVRSGSRAGPTELGSLGRARIPYADIAAPVGGQRLPRPPSPRTWPDRRGVPMRPARAARTHNIPPDGLMQRQYPMRGGNVLSSQLPMP
ncbi:hypothetical protein [Cryptosporangium phraense]|uniref:Uncharacterized protein n=1 Tax=Cryptosporangium phraense TaxID=2593070 RepID=A0A545AEQ5_9ACTN|nr:hypothetical protein [Cryptosporangium phraense]TQS39793.1 hypothetical protein FL583_38125 [Cryptosporangium phraense]